jgi:glycosyltransferase involved in cell wall biosynthesis
VFKVFLATRNAILRRADGFVAITPGIASELARAGVRADKIRSISNGVDTTTFTPVCRARKNALRRQLGMPTSAIVVTYTGRLVSYKGLPTLVEVAGAMRQEHDNVHFVLVGSGGLDLHNCEAELRQQVTRSGLEESVHFAGDVTNVHEYLQASDIFVLPTQDDAFPVALVEAMACGLPVVTTTVGGIPQIVSHESNGLLVAPGSRQELYRALRQLITDASRSIDLGAAAARTANDRYSMTSIGRRYVDLFECLAGDLSRPDSP